MSRRGALGDVTNIVLSGAGVECGHAEAHKHEAAIRADASCQGEREAENASHHPSGYQQGCCKPAGGGRSTQKAAAAAEAPAVIEAVAACAVDLRHLWACCAERVKLEDPSAPSALRHVFQHYSGMGPPRFAACLLNPPAAAPPPPAALLAEVDAMAATSSSASTASSPASSAGATAPWEEPPLTIAETLESWRQPKDEPEFSADAALHTLSDSVLKSCHRESELHRPSPESILQGLGHPERETILLWIFQVCSLRGLSDSMLYSAVLLLDRYCAAQRGPVPMGRLHIAVIAILGIALKVTGGADDTTKPRKLRELLAHLGQQRFAMEEVFKVEVEVLHILGFNVSAPSALDFLTAFVLPFSRPGERSGAPGSIARPSAVVALAQYLLHLSMLNVNFHYRYPHAVLAAGAVYVALWCTRARPSRAAALLRDVARCEDEAEEDDDGECWAAAEAEDRAATTTPSRKRQGAREALRFAPEARHGAQSLRAGRMP